MNKKFFVKILVVVLLLVSSIGLNACMQTNKGTKGLEYIKTDDGKGYVLASGKHAEDNEIVIPSTYNDLPVLEIGENAFANTNIRSVKIPDCVKKIQDNAFYACYRLKEIRLPSSLTTLGRRAFAYCDSLTKVVFDKSCYDWSRVYQGNSWAIDTQIEYVICSDGNGKINYVNDWWQE